MGVTADMHLIDDQIAGRISQRGVSLPVIIRPIDNHAAHGLVDIVAGHTGRAAIPQRKGVAPGVRINCYLARVEPVSLAKVEGAIDAIAIDGARLQTLHEHVPEAEGPVDLQI